MKAFGLGACVLVVLASFGLVVWKSSEDPNRSADASVTYAEDPRSLIEASVAAFGELSSHRLELTSVTEEEGATEDYRADIRSAPLDTVHVTVLSPGSFEAITDGYTAWIKDCGEPELVCDEWIKWPYAQFLVSHTAGVYENTLPIVALDMSRGTELVGIVTDGKRRLAHLRGEINPERVIWENLARRVAVTSGLMDLGAHCGQPIPEGPAPEPGTCPDVEIDEIFAAQGNREMVEYYDEHLATLDAWIDLATLRVLEVSISADPSPMGNGLLFLNARYSGLNSSPVEPPANARDYDSGR